MGVVEMGVIYPAQVTLMPVKAGRRGSYFIVEGQLIVDNIEADCGACALRIRDERYPGAKVGMLVFEDGDTTCMYER